MIADLARIQVALVARQSTLALALLLAAGFSAAATVGDDWTGFQNGGQVTLENERLPLTWDPETGVAWKRELAGYGQSTPVVGDGLVYVTTVSGENKEDLHVQALSLESGEVAWQHDASNSTPEKNSTYVSRAAPSPVADAAGVVACFEGGNIIALSRDGQVRWQRDLTVDYGPITARHGLAASLEQNEDSIFVWVQREEDSYVLAVSKKSGNTLWKAPALEGTSWSSPRLIPVGDGSHLVLSGSGQLVGIDPSTGKRLWVFDDIENNTTPTPMPLSDGRFLIGATDGRGESAGGRAAESNGVIQIKDQGDGKFSASYVWRAEKATCSFGSPIVHNDLAYFVNRTGALYCLDATTGDQLYVKRLAGSIWATPVGTTGRVYFFGKDGTTTVVKAGDEFKQLARNSLWPSKDSRQEGAPRGASSFGGPVLYAAAVSDGRLLLRRGDALYCLQKSE